MKDGLKVSKERRVLYDFYQYWSKYKSATNLPPFWEFLNGVWRTGILFSGWKFRLAVGSCSR